MKATIIFEAENDVGEFKTEKAYLLEELFGYRRKMWFPKSHITLTPQKGLGEEKLKEMGFI